MDKEKILKSGQEQAVGAWIDYLNQIRLNELFEALSKQRTNFQEAMLSLNLTLEEVHRLIDSNRGGAKGLHGFIAEIAECGIGNARKQVLGENANYKWVNDNGPVDLLRDGIAIQQKFVQAGGKFSLGAVAEHFQKYPDYIANGGKYQIPSDYYQKIKELLSMSEKEANRLPSSGSRTLKDWKLTQEFFKQNNISFDSLEASKLSYDSVQVNKIDSTINQEKARVKEMTEKERDKAYQNSKPAFTQGVKVTAWSAAIEGGTALAISITKKIKSGKPINQFSQEDWKEVLGDTSKGTVKGAVRGTSIYLMTNYTATPGAVASGVVTASFGIAEQAYLYREGKLSEAEFIENAEAIALDASISALSSLIGQVTIPIPVVGAVIGNSVGAIIYQAVKGNLSKKEEAVLIGYGNSQQNLNRELQSQYEASVELLNKSMRLYLDILEEAFSSDIEVAFNGSISLCVQLGIPEAEIIDTTEKRDDYFLGFSKF